MNEITNDIARAVRRKRADSGLTKKEVYEQLDISSKTYNKVEQGNIFIKKNVFQKITQWLAKDY